MLDPEKLPVKTLFWRVLVEPVPPKTQSAGGLELPESVQMAERILTTIGRVVQLGSMAFQARTTAGLHLAEEPHKPKVGDYVIFSQYGGQEIHLRDGALLRLLLDTEILLWAESPDVIKGYL